MWQPAGRLRPHRFAAAVAEKRRTGRPLLTRTLHLSVWLLAGSAMWAEGALLLRLSQLKAVAASVAIPCRTRRHERIMLHQRSDVSLGDVPDQIAWLVRPHGCPMPPCRRGIRPQSRSASTPLLPTSTRQPGCNSSGREKKILWRPARGLGALELCADVRCFYPSALGATAARMARACPGSPALWLLSLWMLLLLWVYWSSLSCPNGPSSAVPAVVAYAITTERQRWGELRHTPCDGLELPAAASIGVFEGRTVPLLRTLGHREELATLANQ